LKIPKIKAEEILSIKYNSEGIIMTVKTREGNSSYNGDIGSMVKAGGFIAMAFGNNGDATGKKYQDNRKREQTLKKLESQLLIEPIDNLAPSGTIPEL
jgi:hypothetical protein